MYENDETLTFKSQFYSPFHFQGYTENLNPSIEISFKPNNTFINSNQSIDSKLELEKKLSKRRILRSYCIRFCETTSIRGVPRIIKSSNPKQRLLWTVFVSIFFIACMTCVGFLVSQYRSYDVIHQPRWVYSQLRPFPSLTICNLRPLSSNSIQILFKNNILTFSEYLNRQKKRLKPFKPILNKTETKLITSSWNLNTFILNLPKSIDSNELGHSRQTMVLSCTLVYREGIYISATKCEKAGNWVSIVTKIYHNCHTFTVSEEYSNQTFSLEMVLYLDNFEDIECPDCQKNQIGTQLAGSYLNIHSEGSYPEIEKEGLNVLPGTLTEIKFTPREWSMMEPPHGRCSKSVNLTMSFDNETFKYTESSCKQRLFQTELMRECGCIDYYQVPTELKWAKDQLKICKYLRIPSERNDSTFNFTIDAVKEFTKRTNCQLAIASKLNDILEKCKRPCTYFTYDTSISSAKWPIKSYHTNFAEEVNRIISLKINITTGKEQNYSIESTKDLLEKLNPYKKVVMYKKAKDIVKAKEILKNLSFIEQNFLAVQVFRPHFDITLVEEKAVYSLTSFLSQAGGLLSIWSGITFFCVVELLEMLILISDSLFVKQMPTKNLEEG